MERVCVCLCVCPKMANRRSVVAVHFFSRGCCPFSVPSLKEVGNQRPKESTIRSFGLARVSLCSLLWRIKGDYFWGCQSPFFNICIPSQHTLLLHIVWRSPDDNGSAPALVLLAKVDYVQARGDDLRPVAVGNN